jgi:hypothetical protein
MKKTLLLALILLFTLSTHSFADRNWNFRSWSAATLANLAADPTNWNPASITRFNNLLTISSGSVISANGVAISEIKGLTFGSLGADKLRLDYNTNPGRLMLNGSGLIVNVPNCLVGDTILLVTMTGSTGTARGVTASTNCTRLNADATSVDSLFNVFVVNTAGTASFTATGGLHFRQIKVTNQKIVFETFSQKAVTLPTGWASATYYAGLTTTGTASSASAVVDSSSAAHCLVASGSGSGNRGVGVTFPTSGTESLIDFEYNWYTGDPGTQANKMVDMNFTDASGNSILYFYTENWTLAGVTNHFHCLNLAPAVTPSGSNYDVPAVAIAANTKTLFGKSTSAYSFKVNTYWYKIKARLDFKNKRVVSLTVVSNTDSVTVTDLPFISSLAANLSKMSCATYRNAAANSDGTGTSGNGSNAYLAYKFDNFQVKATDPVEKETYLKSYIYPKLGSLLTWADILAAGTKPETGVLAYTTGSKTTFSAAISAARTVYNNVASTSDALSASYTSLNTAIAAFDKSKKAITGDFLINIGSSYIASTDVAVTKVTAQKDATIWTVATDTSGYITFSSNAKYLQTTGMTGATANKYRLIVNGTTCLLNVVGTTNSYVKIGTDSIFSITEYSVPVKPLFVSKTPATSVDVVPSTVITVTYSANIAIKNASGIKVNNVVTSATVTDKVLTIPYTLVGKTTYKVTIDSAAISHKEDSKLVADKVEFTFNVVSPYVRDKQTMLGAGTFLKGAAYALFTYTGLNNGVMRGTQISANTKDSLFTSLTNNNEAFWTPVLADSTKNIWNLKNYVSGKYLAWNTADSSITISSTPAGWQFSTAGTGATYSWVTYYTTWPVVSESSPLYDCPLNGTTLKLTKIATVGSTGMCVTAMETATAGNIQNYSEDNFNTIFSRAGGTMYANGTQMAFGTPTTTESSHLRIKRLADGHYTFQSRTTGGYLTYVNDTTVQLLPYDANASTKWTIGWNSSKGTNQYYTIWCNKKAMYGGVNGAALGVTNNGNTAGSSNYMLGFSDSGISYVSVGGQPVVSVPSVTSRSISLVWTENKDAAKYVVKTAEKTYSSNNVPYLVDSICIRKDTVSGLEFTIPNLLIDKTYYFTVTPVSKSGLLGVTSLVGNAQTVGLDKFVPAPPIVGTIGMKSIELSWLKNPEALRYTVYYWTKADSSDFKSKTVETTSCVISDLTANTKVYFTLLLHEEYLYSKSSAVASATTLPYSTLKMGNATTYNVTDKSMGISWDEAVDAVSYNIYYTSDISKISTVAPINVLATSQNISGLTPETNYYIQICAVDAKGALSSRSGTKIQKTTKLVGLETSSDNVIGVISEYSTLRILNAQDKVVTVYSITGKKVYSQIMNSADDRLNTNLTQGLYMVRVDNQTVKAMIR